jgi:hypothetical protein
MRAACCWQVGEWLRRNVHTVGGHADARLGPDLSRSDRNFPAIPIDRCCNTEAKHRNRATKIQTQPDQLLVRQQLLERAGHESRHRSRVTGICRPRATRRIVGDEQAIYKSKKSTIA